MNVLVKIKGVTMQKGGGTLIMVKNVGNVWFPTKMIFKYVGNNIVIPEWLAKEKGVQYKNYMHIPKPIEPKYGQEAINELRY